MVSNCKNFTPLNVRKKDEQSIIDSCDSGYPTILCGLDLSVLDPEKYFFISRSLQGQEQRHRWGEGCLVALGFPGRMSLRPPFYIQTVPMYTTSLKPSAKSKSYTYFSYTVFVH